MKASAELAVAHQQGRNIVTRQRCGAPLSIRQCAGRVLLASSAAGPVGGDDLALLVAIGEDAEASVGSVASTMVWPGVDSASSSMRTHCAVSARAHLDFAPEPTISVAGSDHTSETKVDLDQTATCRVVEEVVLGRRYEPSGRLTLSMHVVRGGRAVVRHSETFGPGVAGAGSAVTVGRFRHVVSAVLVGIEAGAPRSRVGPLASAAWLPCADDVAMIMAAGCDRPATLALLDTLAPEFGSSCFR